MLAAGTTLGPYRITAAIGAGGMGEVYRARDTRLARDVAVKVIPAQLVQEPERLKRFEQEARAAGAINHPNVCVIHDVGSHAGAPYVVMELLEGESLRERLERGALPWRKAVEYGAQVARGLAAAHARGIVHRDLKPANLFVTKDGRVKVLDFGLAKLTRPEAVGGPGESSLSLASTETGAILGTAGYMSPEQVRGEAADARSDLFAVGAVVHEMVAGAQLFHRDSYLETMHAILNDEAPALGTVARDVPPGLESVVRRCLEKQPGERFQSASDLAFALESLGGSSTTGKAVAAPAPRWRRWAVPAGALIVLGLVAAATYVVGRNAAKPVVTPYERVTFRRGNVGSARFTPDGQSVVYFASYVGERSGLYVQRLGTSDARSLGPGGHVVGAAGGEIAILRGGTLSRMSIDWGAPRELIENVAEADWSRDGKRFLIVRRVSDSLRLECPPGTVIMSETRRSYIDTPRFSPRGDRIAFARLLSPETDLGGEIVVTDLRGNQKVLTKAWPDVYGLAWSPDGREVWFTASDSNRPRALWAVTLDGEVRLLDALPGVMSLCDVGPGGRVLFTHATQRWELRGRTAADSAEGDLSWLDMTMTGWLSADGRQLIFREGGEGSGSTAGATYLRRMDGSAPVRLADVGPTDVSPDWKWVVGRTAPGPTERLVLVPIGAGEVRELPKGPIQKYSWATFSPAGDRLVVVGSEAGRPLQMFVQGLDGGVPSAFGPEGVSTAPGVFSADGRYFAARPPGVPAPHLFYALDGGEPRPIPGLRVGETPITAGPDGRTLFVAEGYESRSVKVHRLDLLTGARRPWLEVTPPDPVGTSGVIVMLTPDGRYYTYCYQRSLSDLYVMQRPR